MQIRGIKYLLTIIVLAMVSGLPAQTRDKIYIHSDRTDYIAGETIWFKTYLLSAFTPGSGGTNLLIDMVDATGKQVTSGSLPVLGGIASGNIDLPVSLAQGAYQLRAYTRTRPNQQTYSSAVKTVYIFNPSRVSNTPAAGEYQCRFRPSSGHLVAGGVNLVYVTLKDPLGKAVSAEGTIHSGKNEAIGTFKTDASGKARFAISPIPGEKYTAQISFPDGVSRQFELPKTEEDKVMIEVSDVPKAKLFNVIIPEALRKGAAMSVKGFMDDNLIFEKNFVANTDHISARIPVDELPTGLFQIMVTDASKQMLGEAVTMVISDSTFIPVKFSVDSLNLKPGGRNVFSLELPQDIAGTFSVSVTDKDKTLFTAQNNIITGLLINQESKDQSFVSNASLLPAHKEQLDLAIGSADWLDQSKFTGAENPSNDSDFISIYGKIFNKGNKKPITKGDISFMYTTRDSVTSMLSAPIDKDGGFSLHQLIFEGKQLFRYSVNGNKWTDIDVSLDTTRQEDAFRLPFNKDAFVADQSVFVTEDPVKMPFVKETYTAIKADSISSTGLREVVVKSRRISPVQQVNDRYSRGVFSSLGSAKVLDLINEPTNNGGNILDFLQGQIPGLLIYSSGGNYSIQSNRQLSLTMMPPIRLFINEQQITIDYLVGIRAKDVALVKYYPPGMGGALPNVGIGGALVVYTKKPMDGGTSDFQAMSQFRFQGYMPAKDFTVDFLQKNQAIVSKRATLLWNPNLMPEEGKPVYKIRFTNTDSAKRIHIVVEGFTIDGRLLHFEKLVE